MGRYQWQLFIVVGFGWASDNLWPIATSLIFTPIANEFGPSRPPLLSLSQNIGLLAGAIFWGFGCDIFGRKWYVNSRRAISFSEARSVPQWSWRTWRYPVLT